MIPMDSDSETYSDALEDFYDPPISARVGNRGSQPSHSKTASKSSDPIDSDGFRPELSDDPDDKANTPDKTDPNELRKEIEAQLDSEELEKRRAAAHELKEKGNELFKEAKYMEALQQYTEALDLCPLVFGIDRSVMFSNRAACHSKLNAPESAVSDCNSALLLQPNYLKCLMRRAALHEEKERLTDALEDYQSILKLDPGNEKARWACMTLPERIKEQQEKLKEQMLGQLKQLGNMVLKPFGLSTDNFKVQKNPDSEGYSINFVR